MPEVVVKGTVAPDGRIEAWAPEGVPAGEVDLVIHVPETPSIERVKQTLARIAARQTGRSTDDIDAQLQEMRSEWDDACNRRES